MTPIFEFKEVTYKYPGDDRLALAGFSLALPEAEKIAVVGRNGSGKTTFFLHCNGLYRPNSGEVHFRGRPLNYNRNALKALRQQVGLVFQNPDDQLFSASVVQDLSFGPLNLKLDAAEVQTRVRKAAEICDITHLLERPTHALSGGEKEVLMADELLASLDPWVRLAIFEILQRFYDQGKTILMATHDLSVVRYWASFVVVLQNGQVAFHGTPKDLLTNQAVLEETGLAQVWWRIDPEFPTNSGS
jgi:cobalt/nickel transport system ATP-binding protein